MEQLGTGQQRCSILRRCLLPLPLFLQTADHTVDLSISSRGQQLTRLLQHLAIQPQPAGNREGITAARDAPEQLIGRREGLGVEGHRGVLKPGVVVFEGLEFAEMRGGDGESGAVGEGLEQGRRQGGAFTGVGTGPHLIEQHQRRRGAGLQRLQNPADSFDVTAEGGEALLQRLFIADICQNLGAPRQGRHPCTGQQQSCPGHQRRQTDAFEGHRLSAGVGSRDRHHPQVRRHLNRNRHHRRPTGTLVLPDQQRMPQGLEAERCLRGSLHARSGAAEEATVTASGQGQIQLQQDRHQLREHRVFVCHGGAERAQHLAFLLPDSPLQVGQSITDREYGAGFDEHRAARG